jgi:hypothetical protein
MTALSNEIEPESDDQQEVKRLKLENIFFSFLDCVLSYRFLDDSGVANSWGPSFNEGAQSGFILSYRSAFIPG